MNPKSTSDSNVIHKLIHSSIYKLQNKSICKVMHNYGKVIHKPIATRPDSHLSEDAWIHNPAVIIIQSICVMNL